MYESPVVSACAQSCSDLSAAMLVGFARPFRISTPWFASKYGAENVTTFERATVIVASSIAKSYGFDDGEKSPPNGARTKTILLIPRFFAIACASCASKPVGFLIVVPVTRPFQNPGAGTSNPTVSTPGVFSGSARGAADAAAAVSARPTTTTSSNGFLTVTSRDPVTRGANLHLSSEERVKVERMPSYGCESM